VYIWIECVQITSKNRIEGNKFVWNSSCVLERDITMVEMKKLKYIVGVVIALGFFAKPCFANPQDSIGTKVKNGKIYILHQVEKSQGLFAIGRRYGVSLDDIIVANPGSDKMLHINQILLIPTGKDAALEEKTVTEYFAEDKAPSQSFDKKASKKTTFAKYHTVASGETLYSISVLYNTKVDVIKNLNGLESDILGQGQQLMVPATKTEKDKQEKAITEAKQQVDDVSEKLETLKEAINPRELRDDPVVEMSEVKKEKYTVSIEKLPKYKTQKVTETGSIEFLSSEDKKTKGKRVCSHHSASIGSTLMVSNPANNKSVFVKVVANHTLDESKGNIIKLSKTAHSDIEIEDNADVQVSFAK